MTFRLWSGRCPLSEWSGSQDDSNHPSFAALGQIPRFQGGAGGSDNSVISISCWIHASTVLSIQEI